jgi:hypothetical protein
MKLLSNLIHSLSAEASRCLYWGANPEDMPMLLDDLADAHRALVQLGGESCQA